MGKVAYSYDVIWHHPEWSWINPVRAAPVEPLRHIYAAVSKSMPVAAPSPAPAAAPPAPAPAEMPPPTSALKPTAPILTRVSRNLEHEGYKAMSGRTRGETCALRDVSREYAHFHGLLSMMEHAALVSMLANRETTKEIVHEHSASNDPPNLPTAHASDFPTLNSVSDVEKSCHVDVWRLPMDQEFNGLLQAGTFAAGARITISRERDRCQVGVYMESS